jgi:titin
LAVLGNGASGVWIRQAAHDNRIGTNGDGANDVGERNLISGNGFDGIAIEGVGTNGNIVAGNFIGTDNTGTVALGGNHFAVKITNGAKSNRIGTNGDGVADASERNILSGNLWDGVFIADMGTDGNVVAGNYIGVDVNGASALGNNFGVRIDNGAKSNRIGTDANGVADTAERNVISGNRNDGVLIIGADTQNNIIAGNYIGTNASGTAALANAFYGITIQNSPNNIIGGITTAARNVISGNGATGVSIREASATGNKVQGNYVGTDAAGTAAVPNWNGIEIREGAKSNRVGSNADGANDDAERNVISGNTFSGISISGAGTETNVVAGNYIGTNALGTEALANKLVGVAISDAANNIIGGVATAARNVISGNKYSGVVIREAGATGNKVQGNYVGTNAAGAAAVPNHFNGVMVFQGASNNLIGGASLGMGNVVSGNTNAGIRIETAGTTGNVIQGNLVGVAADGVTALGNTPGDESGWGSFRG